MDVMRLQIISPKKIVFDGECTMLEYNTTEGYVGVLPGHIPMTQIAAPGKLVIYTKESKSAISFAFHSGTIKIMPDLVIILAEIIESKSDIDINRAKASLERAEKRLIEKKETDFDMKRAMFSKMKAEARIAVATE